MRIGILTTGVVWTPGGSFLVMYEYANRLSRKGYTVTIAFPLKGFRGREGLKWIYPLSRALRWFPIDDRVRLRKVLPWESLPEQDVWLGMLPKQYIVGKLAGQNVAGVFLQHPKEIQEACSQPFPVIAVSGHLTRAMEQCGKKVFYIPNGIDHKRFFSTSPPMSPERPYDICFSYVPKSDKDPQTGLKVLKRSKDLMPHMKILIFGPARKGPDLPFPYEYRSRVPHHKMPELLNRCKVFLSSSRSEGFNLPALEAMACGCVVVSTDSLGNRDYAIHEVTAFTSPPGDVPSLVRYIQYGFQSPDKAMRVAQEGIRRSRKFAWEKSVDLLENVLLAAVRNESS